MTLSAAVGNGWEIGKHNLTTEVTADALNRLGRPWPIVSTCIFGSPAALAKTHLRSPVGEHQARAHPFQGGVVPTESFRGQQRVRMDSRDRSCAAGLANPFEVECTHALSMYGTASGVLHAVSP